MIEFRILGPLEVVKDGRLLEIGAGKRRTLLAVLLLHANEVVSTDRLVDELWGEHAPATASKIVQGYVSQLRKEFEDGGVLLTQPPGYVLLLEHGQLDAARFAALVAEARAAFAADAAGDASALLVEALALLRGPPLGEFAFDSFAREEISRLEELSLVALEDRIEADLALRRHVEVVPELEALVARHPLRERFRGQLMLALYRCGRQVEALKVYEVTRRVLLEELGLEPGRALQHLEQAILRQDPELDPGPRAAPTRPEPTAAERGPGSIFVGRERELATLLGALDDVLAGRGRAVAIGGEPGIGKSRLAAELADRAGNRGAEVVWGRCAEAGGAPPYWPWVQALRSCVRGRPPSVLVAELGPGAAGVAELVPDARQWLSEFEAPDALRDPEQARFRLFDSITTFLENAARSRPLVLVFEDMNWADSDSLLLLEFVGRNVAHVPVLLVVTYRDIELTRRHPLSRTLAELARERLFERVLPRGLSHEDVARFIQATCAFAPDGALVDAVHTQTEGNPLFVREVVRLLSDEGMLTSEALRTSEHWRARIPDGVREAIGRRLDRLSERCNEALTVASAIGRDFALAQLARVVETLPEDELLEAVDEAIAARLVEEVTGTPGVYQFTHALIQTTLADELLPTQRARLHARVAEAFEELYGARADNHAAELALHFGEAQTVLGPHKLVHYSCLAGESALGAYAPKQALEYFQRGLAARGEAAIDDEGAELLFGLARAQLATLPPNELEPALISLRRVFDYYVERGDTARAVAVAAPLPLAFRGGYTDAAELIARALTLVAPESREAGSLLARHGWFKEFIEGDYDESQQAFEQALAIAKRDDDTTLERQALANAAFAAAYHLRWEDGMTRGLRALELAQLAGDPRTEIGAHRAVGFALVATGKPEQARRHTSAAVAVAEQLRETWWIASASYSNETVCLYEGDWPGARETGDWGLAAEPRDPRLLAQRAFLEYEAGDPDEGSACLAQLGEVTATVPPPGPIADHVFLAGVGALAGCISGDERLLEAAWAAAERLLALPRLNPALALYSRAALGLIAVHQSDANAARELYAPIESERGTASFFFPLTFDRLLGSLALTCGEVETAVGHFEAGLAFCERAGYRPEYAWTAVEWARALRRRAGAGDAVRAAELEARARAIADELGLRALAERMRSLG